MDNRPAELHPLENHLILEVIFQHINITALKACRQVSKTWRQSSKKAWTSTAVANIHSPPGSNGIIMTRFLEFVENPANNYFEAPYIKYSINEDNSRFWNLCGSHVKILELCWISFESVNAFRNAVYNSCQNLEELTLRRVGVLGVQSAVKEPAEWETPRYGENRNLKSLTVIIQGEKIGVSWMEILNHFPFLETINLRGKSWPYDGFFPSLALIRQQDARKLKLKHVDTQSLSSGSYPGHLEFLMNPDHRLESLSIRVFENAGAPTLQAILSTHRTSLKKINLLKDDTCPNLNPEDSLPFVGKLENLQEMSLYPDVFTSFSYLKWTPNLRMLFTWDISSEQFRNTDYSEMKDGLLNKCEELEIKYQSDQIAEEDLRVLMGWMPNIKKLRMPLSNCQLGLVCEYWGDLISLDILSTARFEVDDIGITGLDAVDVKMINDEGESGSWRPITVPMANMAGFKHLKSLSMACNYLSNIKLGYSSAVYGIQQIPRLECLHFRNYKLEGNIWLSIRSRFP